MVTGQISMTDIGRLKRWRAELACAVASLGNQSSVHCLVFCQSAFFAQLEHSQRGLPSPAASGVAGCVGGRLAAGLRGKLHFDLIHKRSFRPDRCDLDMDRLAFSGERFGQDPADVRFVDQFPQIFFADLVTAERDAGTIRLRPELAEEFVLIFDQDAHR